MHMLTATNYVLLDAARMNTAMDEAKALNHGYESLYEGENKQYLSTVAPYLFSFQASTEFGKWFVENGWGDAWGYLFSARVSFDDCLRHLQKFVIVKTEDGQELYFRFYDPRVLKIFLPTCDKKQLTDFFGPIDYFIVEGDTSEKAIQYWHEYGKLRIEEYTKTELFQQEPLPHNH